MSGLVLVCVALLLTTGCADNRFGGNNLSDRTFGAAVREARVRQTLDPGASQFPKAEAGLDGEAAKGTMERYEKSFEAPPATANVYTIGVGSAASGAGP